MTADKYQFYWMSNQNWWKRDTDGEAVIREDAPEEAQKSYQHYIEKKRRRDEAFERMVNTPPDESDDK